MSGPLACSERHMRDARTGSQKSSCRRWRRQKTGDRKPQSLSRRNPQGRFRPPNSQGRKHARARRKEPRKTPSREMGSSTTEVEPRLEVSARGGEVRGVVAHKDGLAVKHCRITTPLPRPYSWASSPACARRSLRFLTFFPSLTAPPPASPSFPPPPPHCFSIRPSFASIRIRKSRISF